MLSTVIEISGQEIHGAVDHFIHDKRVESVKEGQKTKSNTDVYYEVSEILKYYYICSFLFLQSNTAIFN